jgi:aryl-alcohol dehydrogenase-like predicted oxidoreductase
MPPMWPRSLESRTIGIGDISLARSAARGVDSSELTRTVHAALETGIDHVEVAPEEDSEKLVGNALRILRLRDRVLVLTRVPALSGRDVLTERLPPKYVVERVERALRSSKLDVLPVVQLELRAAWRSSKAWPELVDTCQRLVREGKALQYAAWIPRIEEDTTELVSEAWLSAINVPYSLCEREAEALIAAAEKPPEPAPTPVVAEPPPVDDALAAAAARDPMIASVLASQLIVAPPPVAAAPAEPAAPPPRKAILARRVLAGGALAGTLGPGAKLRQRDDRELDAATLERIAVGVAKLARFVKETPPAARASEAAKQQLERNTRPDHVECETLPELALRYVLDHGVIALPRIHRHEHLIYLPLIAAAPPLSTLPLDN